MKNKNNFSAVNVTANSPPETQKKATTNPFTHLPVGNKGYNPVIKMGGRAYNPFEHSKPSDQIVGNKPLPYNKEEQREVASRGAESPPVTTVCENAVAPKTDENGQFDLVRVMSAIEPLLQKRDIRLLPVKSGNTASVLPTFKEMELAFLKAYPLFVIRGTLCLYKCHF